MVRMPEKLTEELLNELVFTGSLSAVLDDPAVQGEETLSAYLNKMLAAKGLKKNDVIRRSRLNQTFAYQIFAGDRKASRSKALQLAFALQLDLNETQRLLHVADAGTLYCKNRRDAIIIHAILQQWPLEETDDTLAHFGEQPILEA